MRNLIFGQLALSALPRLAAKEGHRASVLEVSKDDVETSPIDTVAADTTPADQSQGNQGNEVWYQNYGDACYNTPLLPDQITLSALPCFQLTLPWPMSRQIQFTREGAFKSGAVELVRWTEDMGSPSTAQLHFQTAHDGIGYIEKEGDLDNVYALKDCEELPMSKLYITSTPAIYEVAAAGVLTDVPVHKSIITNETALASSNQTGNVETLVFHQPGDSSVVVARVQALPTPADGTASQCGVPEFTLEFTADAPVDRRERFAIAAAAQAWVLNTKSNSYVVYDQADAAVTLVVTPARGFVGFGYAFVIVFALIAYFWLVFEYWYLVFAVPANKKWLPQKWNGNGAEAPIQVLCMDD